MTWAVISPFAAAVRSSPEHASEIKLESTEPRLENTHTYRFEGLEVEPVDVRRPEDDVRYRELALR